MKDPREFKKPIDPRLPGAGARAGVDLMGRVLMRGRPFFARGWYTDGSIERLRRIAAGHFNCVINYGATAQSIAETRAYLDEAERLKVGVWMAVHDIYPSAPFRKELGSWKGNETILEGVVRAFKDHPALIGWYTNDELAPDRADEMFDHMQRIKTIDPLHPHLIVHEKTECLPAFAATADVFGFDHYPIPKHGPDAFGRIFDQAREALNSTMRGPLLRPLWGVIQNFAWYQHATPRPPLVFGLDTNERARLPSPDEWIRSRPPTAEEIRAMTYIALVHGADGILFWCLYNADWLPDHTERWAAAVRLGAELEAIEDDFLEGKRTRLPNAGGAIHSVMIKSGRRTIVIAVNTGARPLRQTIAVEGIPSNLTTVPVLFEDRSLPVDSASITDFFAPYDRHVYEFLQ